MTQPSGLGVFIASRNFKATLKLDSAGRNGKSVTVIGGLPKHELFLKEMTRQLKAKCGAGGNYILTGKDGVVEIQGDHREKVRQYLESESIVVR